MDNNYDEQVIIMQATIQAKNHEMKNNKQDYDEKMIKLTEDFK